MGKRCWIEPECHAHHSDYPSDLDKEQAEEVAALLDYLRDFGDIRQDLSISDQIKAEREITAMINHLDETGLAVFSGAYRKKIKFGGGDPIDWIIAVVTIAASDDPKIVKLPNEQILPALIPRNQSPVF